MRRMWLVCGLLGLAIAGVGSSNACAQDVTVTPYGFILFNGGYNDHLATDIPVRASLADTGDARASLLFTARQTRVGLKIKSEAEGWMIGGTTELDFWGQKGSFGNGASMQSARGCA